MHDAYVEGNMLNILQTISIYLYNKPCAIENVCIGVDCSPKENTTYTTLFKEYHDVFSWSYD